MRNHIGTSCAGLTLLLGFLLLAPCLLAQMTMPGIAAMENSVGFLSSGTSVEPKNTSESAPMIHTSLGKWTFMFHANAFLAGTQQSGPRGGDKLFSVNWLMPMVPNGLNRNSTLFREFTDMHI